MADREYGREREDDAGRRRDRYSAGPHQRAGEREPEAGREDRDGPTREEQAFGGYPDYREDRRVRGEQDYRRGMPRPYARERAEPYYGVSQGYGGAGHGERYRENMRGEPAPEYQARDRAPYYSSPEAHPPSETAYPQQERGDDWAPRGEPYAPTRYGRLSGATLESQYARGYAEPAANYPDTYRASPQAGQADRAPGETAPRSDEDFDPDYREWRRRQLEALDDDYRAFREERRNRFADEFETYRRNRTGAPGEPQMDEQRGGEPRMDEQRDGEPQMGEQRGSELRMDEQRDGEPQTDDQRGGERISGEMSAEQAGESDEKSGG